MTPADPIDPADALHHARATADRVRAAGRWRVIGWWILTAFCTVIMLGRFYFDDLLDRYDLVLLAATCAALLALAFTARVFDTRARRVETALIAGLIGVMLIGAALAKWILPADPGAWHVLLGLSPILPTTIATARMSRR